MGVVEEELNKCSYLEKAREVTGGTVNNVGWL